MRGHVLRSSHNSPVFYSYSNPFFICDVRGEFGLINVHLFDIFPAISSGKVGIFFFLESDNPGYGIELMVERSLVELFRAISDLHATVGKSFFAHTHTRTYVTMQHNLHFVG